MGYLTKEGVPVSLSDRTCGQCPYHRTDTRYVKGEISSVSYCALTKVHVSSAHKACFYYPKVMRWTPIKDDTSPPSSEAQSRVA